MQPAGSAVMRPQVGEAWFPDGQLVALEGLQSGGAGLHHGYIVAEPREAGSAHQTNIAPAENRNLAHNVLTVYLPK